MLVERTSFAADGTPVEFARDRFRGDRASFVIRVAPDGCVPVPLSSPRARGARARARRPDGRAGRAGRRDHQPQLPGPLGGRDSSSGCPARTPSCWASTARPSARRRRPPPRPASGRRSSRSSPRRLPGHRASSTAAADRRRRCASPGCWPTSPPRCAPIHAGPPLRARSTRCGRRGLPRHGARARGADPAGYAEAQAARRIAAALTGPSTRPCRATTTCCPRTSSTTAGACASSTGSTRAWATATSTSATSSVNNELRRGRRGAAAARPTSASRARRAGSPRCG